MEKSEVLVENIQQELSTSWHSYPKIFAVGHSYLESFFDAPVIVEEKIDGSQFSFGVFNGEIKIRSKGMEMLIDAPEKMFNFAIETVKKLAPDLMNGWTYRAEFLRVPRHNAMLYDRIPKDHLIIFDVNPGHEKYLNYDEKKAEAERLGLECVPKLFEGMCQSATQFREFLETKSILGGQKVEGVVCKNYSKFGIDKKVLMAKFVSEAFKELNHANWREINPKQNDVVQALSTKFKTQTRWNKAIQHLRDDGSLTDSPKDIPNLIKEVQRDLMEECAEEIKKDLFGWASPQISRNIIKGLPEYYKECLLKKQFSEGAGVEPATDGLTDRCSTD